MLSGKKIIVGVTGSIAAYKTVEFVRRLVEAGALVRVVMTAHAKAFVTPLTFQAVSGHPVHEDLFDVAAEAAMGHIELARWADAIVIAPASADLLARLATGAANDLLTTLCLATRAPLYIAPAMNQMMWQHPLTQSNVDQLKALGVSFWGPDAGSQACGEIGPGRLREPDDLVADLARALSPKPLLGKRVLITAGATKELIDPVRYLTNGSSGKMGFALAHALQAAGASVTVVYGSVSVPLPLGMSLISAATAEEMHREVMKNVPDCDIFVGVAAVSDYRPEMPISQKLPKQEKLTLSLVRNLDIIASVAALPNRPYVIGFAAETHDLLTSARTKRVKKGLDMIIANPVNDGLGMGTDDNEAVVMTKHHEMILPRTSKRQLAEAITQCIVSDLMENQQERMA